MEQILIQSLSLFHLLQYMKQFICKVQEVIMAPVLIYKILVRGINHRQVNI